MTETPLSRDELTVNTSPDPDPPGQQAPDAASVDHAAPDQAAPGQAAPDQASPDHAVTDQTALDHATPDQTAPNHATPNRAAPDQPAPNHATPDQVVPGHAAPDQAVPDDDAREGAGGTELSVHLSPEDSVRLSADDSVRLSPDDSVRLSPDESVQLSPAELSPAERGSPKAEASPAEGGSNDESEATGVIPGSHRAGWEPPAPSASGSRAWSGRDLAGITIDAARDGDLDTDDVRIHPDVLAAQADVAERTGNPQLAASLRLAAELAVLPEKELLGVYDLLRPGRASLDAMNEAVRLLDSLALPLAAAHVREAARWYVARGLIG
ncbi:MAG: diol dehydratase small subunit [Actinomycetales bacterium]